MLQLEQGLEQLQKDFAAAGIATDQPGFYEDFQFIRREQKDPTYINNYARFVQWQPYRAAYLEGADEIVHIVVAELQLALQSCMTQAAYDESPFVLSRILEREGIWNYVVHGSLSVNFPAGIGIEPHSFWAIDTDKGPKRPSGYTWVYAPPFQVIDMTIQTQDFPSPVSHLMPRTIMVNDATLGTVDPAEVLSPAAIEELQKEGLPLEAGFDRFAPGFRDRFSPDFQPQTFYYGDTHFKFTPTKIVTCEESLEQFKGFVAKDRRAVQIYEQEIRPRLKDLKDI
jgi:hypothetical protein